MIKKLSFILVLWWLLLSACLGILLLGNAPRIPRPSLMENRMLSGFPELSAQSLLDGSFFSGIEDFRRMGHFACRSGRDEDRGALQKVSSFHFLTVLYCSRAFSRTTSAFARSCLLRT